jgi:gliding motility-associated-like protein
MKTSPHFVYRTLVVLILLTIFLNGVSFAQPPGMPPCAPSASPGETACNATPICNLDGYCGRTLSSYTADVWTILKNAIITCSSNGWDQLDVNNDSYLKFVAGSTSISFDVYVYNCLKPVTTKAIQLAIFSADNCGSGAVDVKYCNRQMNQQNTPHNVTMNNLTPGETYYILIDGYSSQDCAYSFVATSGVSMGLSVNLSQTTICPGESVTATVSGGSGTYTWSGDNGLNATAGSTVTITPPTTPGVYHYNVTSSGTTGGDIICPTSNDYDFSITVYSGNAPTFNQLGPFCSGDNFTLPTTSLEGVNGTWSPAINNTLTTTYTFTPAAAAGQCSGTTTMTIAINNQVTPSFNNPGPVCSGSNFTLPASSLEGINGVWSPVINNTQTTTYTFTPNNAGCASDTTMTVIVDNQITPVFTNPGPVCSGTSFTLPTTSNNGITGVWSPTINTVQTTTYTFTPASGSGSCAATPVTMEVIVNPAPIASAQGEAICTGDTTNIVLHSNIPGTSFTWTVTSVNTSGAANGSGNEIHQTLSSTNGGSVVYTVTPVSGGCSGNPINITVTINATLPVTITPDISICQGESVTLTASGASSYTWSPSNGLDTNSGSTVIASPSITTTYLVTGVSPSGCIGTNSVTVTVLPQPVADFIPSTTTGEAPLEVIFENTSLNATNYIWNFGNGLSGTLSNPIVSTTYHQGGTYTIILIASNGVCADTTSVVITVIASDLIIYVPNVFTPNNDMVNDVFYIGTTHAKTVYVEILNRWGNIITKLEKPTDVWDGGNSPNGVYFYNYKITDLADKLYEGSGFFHLERGKH